jgi:hypothetical protein
VPVLAVPEDLLAAGKLGFALVHPAALGGQQGQLGSEHQLGGYLGALHRHSQAVGERGLGRIVGGEQASHPACPVGVDGAVQAVADAGVAVSGRGPGRFGLLPFP